MTKKEKTKKVIPIRKWWAGTIKEEMERDLEEGRVFPSPYIGSRFKEKVEKMKKHEALEYLKDFEKYLKKEDVKLKRGEKACLNRFIHWLYDKEGWEIGGF